MQKTCPICNLSGPVPFREGHGRDMLICSHCRHVFWVEVPDEEYLSAYYAETYTGIHDQQSVQDVRRAYYEYHVQELASLVGKAISELRIADVGCSLPIFLEQAVNQGCAQAYGVDWSKAAAEYAATVGVSMLTPPELDARIADGSLDILRYSHTLEHVRDPLGMLSDQMRKLRPGGLLYITQPSFPVFKAASTQTDLLDADWPVHLHFFNPFSLRVMIEKCGAKMIKFVTTGNETEAANRYWPMLDRELAASVLRDFISIEEPLRGPLNCYPLFTGENAAAYAIRSPTSILAN